MFNRRLRLVILFGMLATLLLCAVKINKDSTDNFTLREVHKYQVHLTDSLYHVIDSLTKGK